MLIESHQAALHRGNLSWKHMTFTLSIHFLLLRNLKPIWLFRHLSTGLTLQLIRFHLPHLIQFFICLLKNIIRISFGKEDGLLKLGYLSDSFFCLTTYISVKLIHNTIILQMLIMYEHLNAFTCPLFFDWSCKNKNK